MKRRPHNDLSLSPQHSRLAVCAGQTFDTLAKLALNAAGHTQTTGRAADARAALSVAGAAHLTHEAAEAWAEVAR